MTTIKSSTLTVRYSFSLRTGLTLKQLVRVEAHQEELLAQLLKPLDRELNGHHTQKRPPVSVTSSTRASSFRPQMDTCLQCAYRLVTLLRMPLALRILISTSSLMLGLRWRDVGFQRRSSSMRLGV